MLPVRKCQTATRFKKLPNGMLSPTFPSDPQGQDMTLMQMDPKLLQAPDVCIDDFFQSIASIKPSVCQDDLEKQIEFTNNFGSDG